MLYEIKKPDGQYKHRDDETVAQFTKWAQAKTYLLLNNYKRSVLSGILYVKFSDGAKRRY